MGNGHCACKGDGCCTTTDGLSELKDGQAEAFMVVDALHYQKRAPNRSIVAGGWGTGNEERNLWRPRSFVLQHTGEDQDIIIADSGNRRLVRWPLTRDGKECAVPAGTVVAGAAGPPDASTEDGGASKEQVSDSPLLGDFLKVGLSGQGQVLCASYDSQTGISQLLQQAPEGLEKDRDLLRLPLSDLCSVPIVAVCGGPENTVFVLESGGSRVLRFQKNGTTWSGPLIVAGGNGHGSSRSQLDSATNLYVTSGKTVYITDHQNHRIQRWEPLAREGVTVAGGSGAGKGSHQLQFPRGLTVAADKSIYIADYKNNRVVRWPANQTVGEVVLGFTEAEVQRPTDVSLDSQGRLLVLEAGSSPQVSRWKLPDLPDDALRPEAKAKLL
eukprot:TRINITY_DN15220_c0_g1_i1.p1 TRINITY_DN15220_c0_g1~~TRINITY_DN15220_c0_g1_i1.p1  ORF type:complete len:384 (+),score=50.31 TRINITY_DN15220_c0_g1_i1:150-1301(+)